ncbi:sensor domain-containing diguanylate cyclase [Calidifontibacillus oryziterrae]|uniref:sensor domain-containing diguanylate cyclase n=1 Tax=Calidifontibacillus oryziterrae TaxID=1191699 RepID=UPI0002D43D80|nr:diguanylate cyclase [Calidifontibacillus oryziterrae]
MTKPENLLLNEKIELKSFLFDLITDDQNKTNFSHMIERLIRFLKDKTEADSVGLYLYNKWKDRYILEQSTEEIDKKSSKYSLLNDHLKEIEGNYTIKGDVLSRASLWEIPQGKADLIVLLKKQDNRALKFGFIYFEFNEGSLAKSLVEFLELVGIEVSLLLESWKRYYGSLNEDERYEQLYRVTAKFHSSMDMDDVLGEIIHTLKEVYPSFDCLLLLSHDNSSHPELPICELQYGSESANQAAAQAYLTGTVQFEDSLLNGKSILYAPLKGKQGIYGVLQVTAPNTHMFPKQEVGFIELLANTAGSALENAQLYQQSRRLISDLQLINKTSHRLNSNLRLNETISFMTEQITTSFDAEEIGFIMFLSDGKSRVLGGSSEYFLSEDSQQLVDFINKKIKKENDALFIGDLTLDESINEKKYRSLMAVPMIQSDALIGAVYVLNQNPYHFSFEKFKLLQSLIHHSTLAFTNSMLREELEKMVITDHLTKLYSRNYLDEKIQQSMNFDALGAFLIIDIDNFKLVNDTYGHQIGDEVIIQVANIIKRSVRDHDIAARWGGEELAIYLPKASLEIGMMVAKRLVNRVAAETDPKVTISCGISFWTKERTDSVKRLFNRADEALYKAKQSGKNRVVIYEEKVD